jgi:hypothetical protein
VVSLMMRVSFDKGFISRKIWANGMEMTNTFEANQDMRFKSADEDDYIDAVNYEALHAECIINEQKA